MCDRPWNITLSMCDLCSSPAACAPTCSLPARRSRALELLGSLGKGGDGGGKGASELAELLWTEMGLPDEGPLTEAAWSRLMTRYLRRWGGGCVCVWEGACVSPAWQQCRS